MSSPQRPIPDVSVKAIMDRFSHYGSKVIAKFILPAAETEMQQKEQGLLDDISPRRSTLFNNFCIINHLTMANPETGRELKLDAAGQYVND